MRYRNLLEDEKVTIRQLKNIFIFSISLANLNEHTEESGRGDKCLTRNNTAVAVAILQRCCASRKDRLVAGWQSRKTSGRWWHSDWDCMDKGRFTRGRIRVSPRELVVKNPPASAGDVRDAGSIPESGSSPGGGHGNPLQCSCLENPVDRGAWRAAVPGVARSRTWLKQLCLHTQTD